MSTALVMPPATGPSTRASLLADPTLRRDLIRFARRRLREDEAEDVVQATLTDALAAKNGPDDPEEVRRWVHGIARNKIVDHHRRGGREVYKDTIEEAPAESAPLSARDLLNWAERELPEGADSTLEWMLREGDGEKLEHIAEDVKLPAPRVRQRVSRLRRHFRSRWAAQLAAVAALTAAILAAIALWRGLSKPGDDDIAREPVPEVAPRDEAERLRRLAFERCDAAEWTPCLEGLDRAQKLDPAGDSAPRVQEARRAAARGLAPQQKGAPEQKTAPEQKLAPPSSADVPTKSKTAPVPTEAPLPKLAPEKGDTKVPTKSFDTESSLAPTPPAPAPAPAQNAAPQPALQKNAVQKKAAPKKPAPQFTSDFPQQMPGPVKGK